jgi:hypothetical protein
VSFINYIPFDKAEAMKIIQDELGWKYYGGKHYESIYTRFYQAYILPKKFNIDKRKAHLTCLIASTGEVTRNEALEILKQPTADPKLMEEDKEYVIKKFGITEKDFDDIMNASVKSILDYPNIHVWEMKFRRLLNKLRKAKILPN